MKGVRLFGAYFVWHYGRGLADMFGVFGNLNWFLFHFFSIPVLLRTFFSPFQRLSERYGGNILDLGYMLGSFAVNVVMRLVGMVLRTFVILAGCIVLLAALSAEACIFVLWFFLPLLDIAVFAWGVWLLASLV
jgi:hypothetical protein